MPLIHCDVAIIGAGPVGSLAAIAHARRGARVLLLEADPRAKDRFAGEWLHPHGVQVLDRLRVGRLDGSSGRTAYGFHVIPDDGSHAIELPYTPGATALTCEHGRLVEIIRAIAAADPGVDYRPFWRVARIDGHTLYVEDRQRGRSHEVRAERIVGADGRTSAVRAHIGGPKSALISYMAGVELHDASLPLERYGHVILGGPGPILMYRIDENRVRACFDVPLHFGPRARSKSFLWDGFGPVLPESLVAPFRAALAERPVQWAATRFLPRALYGTGPIALVGDAVGHVHPMTAVGMTQGFLDAEALALAPTVEAYQRAREQSSYVPELLGNALYHVFRRDDPSAAEIRAAVYRVWRASDFERERTMRILTGAEQRTRAFGSAFVHMAVNAVRATVGQRVAARDVRGLPARLVGFREWAKWPLAALVPSAVRVRYRGHSTVVDPIPALGRILGRPGNTADDVQPAHTPRPACDNDIKALVERALERGVEVGHQALVLLAPRVGVASDVELARIAVPLIRAIEAATTDRIMAKRMRLGRRRLATDGARTYCDAHARDAGANQVEDLANLVLVLFDVRTWTDEGMAGLDEVIDRLRACQHPSGGFSARPGEPPALAETALALSALAAHAARLPTQPGSQADSLAVSAERLALAWLRAGQQENGSWGDEDDTAAAVQALVALGVPVTDAALRRAARWLISRQTNTGSFCDSGGAECLARTARVLYALSLACAPFPDDLERAAAYVASQLLRHIDKGGRALESADQAAARGCLCVALSALAAWYRRRAERPEHGHRRAARHTERLATENARPSTHSAEDWQFCRGLLVEVSRTFSQPIAMLPGALEVAVTCGYLLCRVADTIEDHPHIALEDRDALFALFLDVLERGRAPDDLARALSAVDGDDPELRLGRNFPRVMRVFDSLAPAVRRACTTWVAEMARGMALYVHRPAGEDGIVALHTVDDLERYCYFVAGTVGHLLTDLFTHELHDQLAPEAASTLRRLAERFGAGLQLVNILKDVTDDRARGWSFIPRSACGDQGLEVEQLTDPVVRARAHAVVAPLMDLARGYLDDALAYTLAIPADNTGVRMFCLLPLWMAARTLVLARDNDAVFSAGMPVKIDREEVAALVAECAQHCADNQALAERYAALWPNDGRFGGFRDRSGRARGSNNTQ